MLFNTLSRFVIAFLPRSNHLLISWLQSPSAVILEPKTKKSVNTPTFSLSICHEVMGSGGCNELTFVNFEFQAKFFTLLFHTHQRDFSSSLLSDIKVVSCAYVRLLIFLPTILIPACDSSSLAFLMMCSPYRLNKQGDSRQPCHTPFSILNQSVVPYRVLTVASCIY